jgi:copper(I)-binding protein
MKKTIRRLVLGAACLAAGFAAQAHEYTAGTLLVGHPYARATVPGQPVGAGYLSIENKGKADDRLVSVTADVSASVELHSMTMDGDIARMRQLEAIDVPAGKKIELKPAGMHVMFLGLKGPLKAGTQFPATLKFEKAGEVKVDIKVEAPGAKTEGHHHH